MFMEAFISEEILRLFDSLFRVGRFAPAGRVSRSEWGATHTTSYHLRLESVYA
jgi:hypothetical protein